MDICQKLNIQLKKCYFHKQKRKWCIIASVEPKNQPNEEQPPNTRPLLKKYPRYMAIEIRNEDPDFMDVFFPEEEMQK